MRAIKTNTESAMRSVRVLKTRSESRPEAGRESCLEVRGMAAFMFGLDYDAVRVDEFDNDARLILDGFDQALDPSLQFRGKRCVIEANAHRFAVFHGPIEKLDQF